MNLLLASTHSGAESGVLLFFALVIYITPWGIASSRKHVNTAAIAVINVFLGWTLIGWVVALAWAFTANTKEK